MIQFHSFLQAQRLSVRCRAAKRSKKFSEPIRVRRWSAQMWISKIPSQQQKGLIRQLGDLQHILARQTMFRRDGRQHMGRRKQPPAEVLVTGYHKREVDIATFQAFRDTRATVLDEVDFHGGMTVSITRQEIRKQCPGLSALQGARVRRRFLPPAISARRAAAGLLRPK